MANVICLLVSGRSESAAAEAVLCLTSLKRTDKAVITPKKYTYEGGYDVCVRYQTRTESLWTWAYGATSSAQCAQMMHQTQQYRNVHCCMQRNCNTPDPVLDPNTQVVFPGPKGVRSNLAATDQQAHQARTRRLHQQPSKQDLALADGSKGSWICCRSMLRNGSKLGLAPAVAARDGRQPAGAKAR